LNKRPHENSGHEKAFTLCDVAGRLEEEWEAEPPECRYGDGHEVENPCG
jgi:hypothetical protein